MPQRNAPVARIVVREFTGIAARARKAGALRDRVQFVAVARYRASADEQDAVG
jgi:hypothetical protein